MEEIPPVLINNAKVNDPQKITDVLENYWKSRLTSGSKKLKNTFPRKFPDFKIISTTEIEIKQKQKTLQVMMG
jgi:hypothetical protein